MATVALAISIVALLVSTLTWWMGYQRSGAVVRVTGSIEKNYQWGYVNGLLFADVVHVTARNKGLATVELENLFYMVEGDPTPPAPVIPNDGPSFSTPIPGLHQEAWTLDLKSVLDDVRSVRDARRFRVGVTLSTGATRKSGWIEVE
jgi:hypothetical protein